MPLLVPRFGRRNELAELVPFFFQRTQNEAKPEPRPIVERGPYSESPDKSGSRVINGQAPKSLPPTIITA